jgi:hypothetical protein
LKVIVNEKNVGHLKTPTGTPTKTPTVTYQGHGVEDVDEECENLSVKMGGEEGAERSKEDDDGSAHGQVLPRANVINLFRP